jgi:hypothetical protein
VIACPHCHASLATPDVLDAGTVALPGAPVVLFQCPRCDATAWAHLADGELAIGPANGDPARFPRARDPELSVRPDRSWLDCWHGGRYRRYPVRLVEPAT